jgi:hypothetical protein
MDELRDRAPEPRHPARREGVRGVLTEDLGAAT